MTDDEAEEAVTELIDAWGGGGESSTLARLVVNHARAFVSAEMQDLLNDWQQLVGDAEEVAVSLSQISARRPTRHDRDEIALLAGSIRRLGLLKPLIVLHFRDRYRLLSGAARYRAAAQAGLVEARCIVLPYAVDSVEAKAAWVIEQLIDDGYAVPGPLRDDLWRIRYQMEFAR